MNSRATAEEAFFQTTFIQSDDVFSKPAPVVCITCKSQSIDLQMRRKDASADCAVLVSVLKQHTSANADNVSVPEAVIETLRKRVGFGPLSAMLRAYTDATATLPQAA